VELEVRGPRVAGELLDRRKPGASAGGEDGWFFSHGTGHRHKLKTTEGLHPAGWIRAKDLVENPAAMDQFRGSGKHADGAPGVQGSVASHRVAPPHVAGAGPLGGGGFCAKAPAALRGEHELPNFLQSRLPVGNCRTLFCFLC